MYKIKIRRFEYEWGIVWELSYIGPRDVIAYGGTRRNVGGAGTHYRVGYSWEQLGNDPYSPRRVRDTLRRARAHLRKMCEGEQ